MENPLNAPQRNEYLLADLFFDLYKGLHRAYGRYTLGNGRDENNKQKGTAATKHGDYTVQLWNEHLEGKAGLGVVPIQENGNCWWGAIDIDVYPLDHDVLEKKIRAMGLPLILMKTKSGGAHLTCFFSEPVPAKKLRQKLYEFAVALGYADVERFPKQQALANDKDVGNWLNMPYFGCGKNGDESVRCAYVAGRNLTALEFIELANKLRLTETALMEVQPIEEETVFSDGPPCLQMLAKSKAPQGRRNIVLFNMGTFAKKKFGDDFPEQLEEMNRTAFTKPLPSSEVAGVIKNHQKKDYGYQCGEVPLVGCCNREECKKRTYGIASVEDTDLLPVITQITKIDTRPPKYIVEIEDKRIQVSADTLFNYRQFAQMAMEELDEILPMIKEASWRKVLKDAMDNRMEIQEAPEDTRPAGRIKMAVQRYLSTTGISDSMHDLERGMAVREGGRIYVSSLVLVRFITSFGLRVEPDSLWATLSQMGATNRKHAGQTYWALPASMAPDQHLETPDLPNAEF